MVGIVLGERIEQLPHLVAVEWIYAATFGRAEHINVREYFT